METRTETVYLESYVPLPEDLTTQEWLPEIPVTINQTQGGELIAGYIKVCSALNIKIAKIAKLEGEVIEKQQED